MKKIIIFVAGAVIGAGGMYLYMRKKTDDIINKEIESVKETYNALAEKYNVVSETATANTKTFVESMDKVKNDIMNDIIMQKPPSEEDEERYVPYNKNFEKKDVVAESEPEDSSSNIFDQIDKIIKDKTFLITEEEYSTEHLDFGKEELFYSINEGELKDTEGIAQAPIATVGEGTIEDCLDEGMGPGDTLYVRNELTETDYQVNVIEE